MFIWYHSWFVQAHSGVRSVYIRGSFRFRSRSVRGSFGVYSGVFSRFGRGSFGLVRVQDVYVFLN